MLCIGIDISKARFDGAVCVEGVDHNPSFANDHRGFKALSKWLKSLDAAQERLCKKPSIGMSCGKPNPLNPPCQGDLSLNSPLIRGARGVRNDEYWIFAQSLRTRLPAKCNKWRAGNQSKRVIINPDFDGLSLLNRWQPNKHAVFGRKVVL